MAKQSNLPPNPIHTTTAPPTPPAPLPRKTVLQATMVTVQAPVLHVVDPSGKRPYMQCRIDMDLSGAEANSLRDLYDGLCASGVFARANPSPADALRWLIRQLADQGTKAKG